MRRWLALGVALLLALGGFASLEVARTVSAGAATTFTLYGAGWGHGVGMGQWGAYGLAQKGWTSHDILTHYYRGTSIASISSPTTLRVGLLQQKISMRLDATNGPIAFRLGDPSTGKLVATIPNGQTWTVEFHRTGQFWIKRQSGSHVGGHGWGGPSNNLYANYFAAGTIVSVPGTGHRYKYGFLEFNIYRPGSRYLGRLVLVLGTNVYVYGIAEVPASWPVEALKVQATASRTFAVYRANTAGQHQPGCNCAVDDGTNDQVYDGYDIQSGFDGARWVAAADATRWQVVEYKGKPISANFSSSTGGFSESNAVAFGVSPLPYLTAVCDPGDDTAANPNRAWTVQLTGAQLGNQIDAYKGSNIGDATSFSNTSRSTSGRILHTTIVGTNGSVTVTGNELRTALGLKSSLVYVNTDRRVAGAIRTKYDGLMCAPGLSTTARLSPAGGLEQDFANGNIYVDNSSGIVSYVSGPTLDEYVSAPIGGPGGVLGFPSSDVVQRTGFRKTTFAHDGAIYWSVATGAHEVHGVVKDEYYALSGATGVLGLPISDVMTSGVNDASTFEHGTITCPTGGSVGDCVVS